MTQEPNSNSASVRENSMTSAQLVSAGKLAELLPEAAWFASYFSEEGDPDLYLQDLTTGRMWRITRGGTGTPCAR